MIDCNYHSFITYLKYQKCSLNYLVVKTTDFTIFKYNHVYRHCEIRLVIFVIRWLLLVLMTHAVCQTHVFYCFS